MFDISSFRNITSDLVTISFLAGAGKENPGDLTVEENLKIEFIIKKSVKLIKERMAERSLVDRDKTVNEILQESSDSLSKELFKGIVD
jgi:hypothetical protein